MSPQRNTLFLSLGLFLVLALSACQSPAPGTSTPEPSTAPEGVSAPEQIQNLTRDEIQAMAEETAKANRVVFSSAVKEKDLNACATLASMDAKSSCEQHVYVKLALENQDSSYCKNLSTEKAKKRCISDVSALKKQN